jgi:hypothetical protein
MKFTFWDQLVLNITGRLPRKTQEEVDALLATKAMIARVAEMEHLARIDAAARRKLNKAEKGSTIDLVNKDKPESLGSPKKKATPKKKKPSKG